MDWTGILTHIYYSPRYFQTIKIKTEAERFCCSLYFCGHWLGCKMTYLVILCPSGHIVLLLIFVFFALFIYRHILPQDLIWTTLIYIYSVLQIGISKQHILIIKSFHCFEFTYPCPQLFFKVFFRWILIFRSYISFKFNSSLKIISTNEALELCLWTRSKFLNSKLHMKGILKESSSNIIFGQIPS